jgi:hypothetical protein
MIEENKFDPNEAQILKRIPRNTFYIVTLFSVVSYFLFSFLTSIIIFSGGLISILNFLFLKDAIIKFTTFHKKKALVWSVILYFFRFILIFGFFFIIISLSSENLLSLMVGFSSIFVAMGIEAILALGRI